MQIINYFKNNYRQIAKSYTLIIIGSLLLAVGTGLFLIPNRINAGGISGVAIILNSVFGFEEDIVVLIMAWGFFALSLIFLGLKFTLKSLVSSLIYPLSLVLLMRLPFFQTLVQETFLDNPDTSKTLIAGIFGGVFVGAGVAITFLGGGSTGGVDILVFIIHKYTQVKQSVLSFVVDGAVIALGVFALGDMIASMIGIVAAFITAIMIEYIFVGRSKALTALIISKDHVKEINEYIQDSMERGSTLIPVAGGYQKHAYEMIMVTFDRKEYANLIYQVSQIDKRAFLTVIQTNEVLGEGFRGFRNRKRKGK
ncbi:MAG TPA: YitT family protein [Bacilli bacterium]|nr:YitT family protein [Bacilli bacterium]